MTARVPGLLKPAEYPQIPAGGWRARALCGIKVRRGEKPASLWDDKAGPEDGCEDPDSRRRRIAAAQAICARCPVRDACLADANPRYDRGVRGGHDLREWDDRSARTTLSRLIAKARAEVDRGAA